MLSLIGVDESGNSNSLYSSRLSYPGEGNEIRPRTRVLKLFVLGTLDEVKRKVWYPMKKKLGNYTTYICIANKVESMYWYPPL
jgi:hypothetical protein